MPLAENEQKIVIIWERPGQLFQKSRLKLLYPVRSVHLRYNTTPHLKTLKKLFCLLFKGNWSLLYILKVSELLSIYIAVLYRDYNFWPDCVDCLFTKLNIFIF